MKHSLAKTILVLSLSVLGVNGSTPAEAQPGSVNARECMKNILANCRNCIFTVNAYHRIPTENTNGNKPSIKWQRNVGTAISIDSEGYLITLGNVVKDAQKVKVITENGKSVPARIVGSDYSGFITVLKIDANHINQVPETTSMSILKTGESVYFLGVVAGMSVQINHGTIENLHQSDGTFEVTAINTPGTAGTPVFDGSEHVIGLLAYQVDGDPACAVFKPDAKSYLVVSLEHATLLAHKIISENKPKCGWLGVCIDLTESGNEGVLITNVIKNSPASRASLRPNDRIIGFNGKRINGIHEFSNIYMRSKAGETVPISVLRDGSSITVDITLMERTE